MIQRFTLADLRTQLQDRWESVPFWSPEEARLAINESFRWWNIFTGAWCRRIVFGLPVRTHFLTLPNPILYRARVLFLERPLTRTSIFDLDYGHPNWQAEFTDMGGSVPRSPRAWAPVGLTGIAIWPASHEGCHSLQVEGVAATPVLLEDTDYADIEESEIQAVLGEALHVAGFKEGGARWKTTDRYHKEFLMAAADRNARIRSVAFFRRYLGLDDDRRFRKLREPVEATA